MISKSEKILGLRFSHEYCEYLRTFDLASFSGHELTGIRSPARFNIVEVTNAERIANPTVPMDCG